MFIEATVAVGLICASTQRRQSCYDVAQYYCSSSPVAFIACSGPSLENLVSSKIQNLPNVGIVSVRRNGTSVAVDVEMSKFDKTARRNVYAVERALATDYPNHSIDVRLIDNSPEHQLRDAVEG